MEEQLLINYYLVKHLILLKIRNMMDIKLDLHQWFITFLILSVVLLKKKLCKMKYELKIYKNLSLKSLGKEKYAHLFIDKY